MAADGKILALGVQVSPDGSQTIRKTTFKNKNEYEQERDLRQKRAERTQAANTAISEKCIRDNGGSDIQMDLRKFSHPGNNELRDSLNTFHDGWRALTERDLYMIIPQYKCPSNVSKDLVHQYRERSKQEIKETQRYSDALRAAHPAMRNIVLATQDEHNLAPTYWMEDQMQRLCVKPEARANFSFTFGRMARNRTEGEMWAQMILVYNGHIKSLTELMKYAS